MGEAGPQGRERAPRDAIEGGTAAYHTHAPIEARQVSDDARIHSLPHHFGRHMLTVEDAVYRWMRRLVPEYSGGYWRTVASTWPRKVSPCSFESMATATKVS